MSGWRASHSSLARVSTSAAPHGRRTIRVRRAAGISYGLTSARAPVSPALAGSTFRASAWVRAGSRRAVGKPLFLVVRERGPKGLITRRWRARGTLARSFARIQLPTAASRRGTVLEILISQGRAAPGDAFDADLVTLVPRPSAPGQGASPPRATPAPAPLAGGYRPPFSAGSPFNTRLSATAPLDPNSAQKAAAITPQPFGISYDSWSPAVYHASGSDPMFTISLEQTWSATHGRRIRIPAAARPPADITDGPEPDNHMTVVFEGIAYSFWQAASPRNAVLQANAGGMSALDGIGSNLPNAVGGRASGISQIAGLITPEDIQSGEIRHALAMSVDPDAVSTGFLSPAIKTDGNKTPSASTVKEGQRLRLPASVDLSTVGRGDPRNAAFARMIAVALRDYGAIVVDRGGGGFYMVNPISYTSLGQPNPWPALVGPLSAYGSYNAIVRDSGIPWASLQVLREN